MKIRNGFVSNSSSSSFIVNKNICKELEKLNINQFNDQYDDSNVISLESLSSILNIDIQSATPDDLRNSCHHIVYDMIFFLKESLTKDSTCRQHINGQYIDYNDVYDYQYIKLPYQFCDNEKTELLEIFKHKGCNIKIWDQSKRIEENVILFDEYNHILDEFVDKVSERLYNDIKDDNVVSLTYSDDTDRGCLIEHTVMKELEDLGLVQYAISNH